MEAESSKVSAGPASQTEEDVSSSSPIVHEENETAGDHEEHLKESIKEATELKQEAADHFRAENWAQALATYTMALGRLPRRVQEPKPYEAPPDSDAFTESSAEREESKESDKKPVPPPLMGIELECAKLRAVLNANIGACHVKLEEYKEAVKACTEALADDPSYIKALQRRASCNEKIGSWSSLASAKEDYNTLLVILPPNSPQVGQTRRALAVLEPRIEEAQKRETSEMMDKLKGIGNSILGNFGLSTDNFKFEPNGQGGYSMNFVR
ncbi:hypothetical protein A7U60_g5855 [Sanghuangporus baumii]|uniref:Tetratricopeptide repeat protein 1 n=1 Tax=Sanghuangporus baumii TaxID=108892 RepID=A0A9Q5N318_SANBA|nr:hypothetical protein A7U60_g5855 [Sanghuangporus baumii]